MSRLERIAAAFNAAQQQDRAALMPYFTLGSPDGEASTQVIQAIAAASADLIELGIPFSDPLADGPSIQHSTQVALEHGANVQVCLDLTRQLRGRGGTVPF